MVVLSRPGTIQTVDIEQPRNVFEVRFDERFRELHQDLWAILQGDMLSGEEM
ncbi:MAG: hypothetical protein H0T99_04255 [Geodermatophilaceae bacterium]|nr:hypothetical protein [Geodermatophilaceae bacterium]MDQ3481017.1 hypothetical protein [Actinomycetota bacterium]